MKKILFFILLPCLFFVACGDREVSYSTIYRDQFETGGDISFSYDNITHTAHFGGNNEIIQYCQPDISKGWQEGGHRIGISLNAPIKLTNPLSAHANLDGIEYDNGSFLKSVNGEITNRAEFYPVLSQEKREIELKIVWQDGITEQVYKIVINEGTIFL